ncbi:LOW QUALITY PROTEIN: hypothetical protein ACHAWF_010308 [Thalassiosira exigua]
MFNDPAPSIVLEQRKARVVNIFDYLRKGNMIHVDRLYFPPNKYPPPEQTHSSATKSQDTGWDNSRLDIESNATENGSSIFSDGSQKSPGEEWSRMFRCSFRRQSREKTKSLDTTYWGTALVNNRKLNRRDGKNMPENQGAPFGQNLRFTIKLDKTGFYVDLGFSQGHGFHNGHPVAYAPLAISTRHMPHGMKRGANHVMMATCNKSSGRNYLFTKFGRFINRAKISTWPGVMTAPLTAHRLLLQMTLPVYWIICEVQTKLLSRACQTFPYAIFNCRLKTVT